MSMAAVNRFSAVWIFSKEGSSNQVSCMGNHFLFQFDIFYTWVTIFMVCLVIYDNLMVRGFMQEHLSSSRFACVLLSRGLLISSSHM